MGNSEQVKILKEVLSLEKYAAERQRTLNGIKAERFTAPPNPPVCGTITRTYPEIVPQVEFDKVKAFVPSLFFWPWILIYYFKIYKKEQKEEIERIRNSEEYKAKCAELDAEYDKQEAAVKQKYEAEKKMYDEETMPQYQKALERWMAQHDEKIQQVDGELRDAKVKLVKLYEETKIVPVQYRNIATLQYIYDLMATSDYDVKEAIDVYDRNEQKRIDMARLEEERYANMLADEQNDLIYEQNAIAEKARKDAKTAAIIGTVQRHNTNKILKGKKKR